MGNHKSALKQHRQDERRRVQNRHSRSRLRTAVKKLRKALAQGDVATAKSLLAPTLALVDRTAKLGAIHGNTADRTKSRLTRAVNR
jgi:small subunit ribosomal protein S20